MLDIRFSNKFKQDYKLAIKRGCKEQSLSTVLSLLANEKQLPRKYRDHELVNSKKYKNARECHIEPDWLLVYRILKHDLILELLRTGTHSDLF